MFKRSSVAFLTCSLIGSALSSAGECGYSWLGEGELDRLLDEEVNHLKISHRLTQTRGKSLENC